MRSHKFRMRPGHHLVICDLSGFTFWDDETRMTWDGKRVGKEFWEPRHPQDFVRGRKDDQSIKDARPEGADTFQCEGVYEAGVHDLSDGRIFVTCVE